MGHATNDALIISIAGYAWDQGHQSENVGVNRASFQEWRSKLPLKWQSLIVGPIAQIENGGWTIAMLPDGSKSGWDTDEEGDDIRDQLVEMFSFDYGHPSDSPFDVVQVRWSFDPGAPPQVRDPRESDESQ